MELDNRLGSLQDAKDNQPCGFPDFTQRKPYDNKDGRSEILSQAMIKRLEIPDILTFGKTEKLAHEGTYYGNGLVAQE